MKEPESRQSGTLDITNPHLVRGKLKLSRDLTSTLTGTRREQLWPVSEDIIMEEDNHHLNIFNRKIGVSSQINFK